MLTFSIVVLAITVASRTFGLTLGEDRFAFLTGMFFGSRLAEFGLGMLLARWLSENRSPLATRLHLWRVCGLAYVAGLAASIFLPTTIFSPLLVSTGMTGFFYLTCRKLTAERWPARFLSLIGTLSFGVFLIHQAPMDWLVGALWA